VIDCRLWILDGSLLSFSGVSSISSLKLPKSAICMPQRFYDVLNEHNAGRMKMLNKKRIKTQKSNFYRLSSMPCMFDSQSRSWGLCRIKGKKVAPTRLPNVGFRSWSRFLAVSLQVTWVINPAVGWHYFPLGLQLPPQPLRGLLLSLLLSERGTMGVNSLPKTVTRQRRDCDSNPGLLRLSPAR